MQQNQRTDALIEQLHSNRLLSGVSIVNPCEILQRMSSLHPVITTHLNRIGIEIPHFLRGYSQAGRTITLSSNRTLLIRLVFAVQSRRNVQD